MTAGSTGSSAIERLAVEMQRPPFNAWLKARAVEVDEENKSIVMAVPYREELSFHPQEPIFHGGVIATAIDIAGYASVAIWHSGPTPTLSLQIEYLAPAKGDELIARASVRKLGRTVSRCDVEVSVSGKLVALGRGTFAMSGGSS